MLQVKNLKVCYGQIEAIKDVSLHASTLHRNAWPRWRPKFKARASYWIKA